MMPGENPSAAGGVASEATKGSCQNCTILNQSLEEYVSALLTLKQKIIDTDLLLSQYRDKCDELQKSQRESSQLHKELDDVLLKLGPLEKQSAESESLKCELEETKASLKVYQEKALERDRLEEENAKTLALKAQLEDHLRKAEDAVQTRDAENTKLQAENTMLEGKLQKTQEALRESQEAAEELDSLKLENAKTLILKSNLENQLLALEDSKLKQRQEIQHLSSKGNMLEENLRKTQEQLAKLEKELNKETRCSATQTETEPHIDKDKFRMLLQELWCCVNPSSPTPENFNKKEPSDVQHLKPRLFSPSLCPTPISPFRNGILRAVVSTPKPARGISEDEGLPNMHSSLNPDQEKRKPGRKKKRSTSSEDGDNNSTQGDPAADVSLKTDTNQLSDEGLVTDLNPIRDYFRPLPAALSPIPNFRELVKNQDGQLVQGLKKSLPSTTQNTQPSASESVMCTKITALKEAVMHPKISCSPNSSEEKPKSPPIIAVNTEHPALTTSSENLETLVDASCRTKENVEKDVPPLTEMASLEYSYVNPETPSSTSGPQLSPMEVDEPLLKGQIRSEPDSETPEALCNGVVSHGSDTQLRNGNHECLNTHDNSVNGLFKAEPADDGSESPLSVTELERRTEDGSLQNTDTAVERHLKFSEEQNHNGIPVDGINGAPSAEDQKNEKSSDEEHFALTRKTNGICSRLKNLNGDSDNKPHADGTQENGHDFKNNEDFTVKNGVNGICLKDSPRDMCEPVDPGGPKQNVVVGGRTKTDVVNDVSDESQTPPQTTLPDESQNEIVTVPSVAAAKANEEINFSSGVGSETEPPSSSVENPPETDNAVDLPLNLSLGDSRNTLIPSPPPEAIGKVRTEMGPPLPPILLPLMATPPKFVKRHTPLRPCGQLPISLSATGQSSVKQQPIEPSDLGETQVKTSSGLTTPSPTPSSPLQFGTATPKHAVPVPGRLPSSALCTSSPSTPQENSMQMLDTMYPELSAQARTLNILRGTVSERSPFPPSVNSISGNKTINSSSTAFTKTREKVKRIGPNVLLPKSAKRLRLDACSPDPMTTQVTPPETNGQPRCSMDSPVARPLNGASSISQTQSPESEVKMDDPQARIFSAIEKLATSCFDLLPVIRSHVFLKRISDVPALIDEEKSVISDFCSDQPLMEEFMSAILSKIKTERAVLKPALLQSLCRVYAGLCRQSGDCVKAQALAYSLLKEGIPEASMLILFLVCTWPSMLSHQGSLCRAIHTVCKLKAKDEILDCLNMYMHWDKNPPVDIYDLINRTLKALFEDDNLSFQTHQRYGHDLGPTAWEYIFSLDLLCTHVGWKWTHDNVIGKQLWPVMNNWVIQPRGQQTPVADSCVAAVLRLIGRLGQLGIKEKLCTSVQNVAKAINLFGKHGITEGVPWEVQLSAVYSIYDLAPSNPKDALDALASWRGETTQPVPAAVTSCITQIGSLCRQIKP